jgi:hypothetical protein
MREQTRGFDAAFSKWDGSVPEGSALGSSLCKRGDILNLLGYSLRYTAAACPPSILLKVPKYDHFPKDVVWRRRLGSGVTINKPGYFLLETVDVWEQGGAEKNIWTKEAWK